VERLAADISTGRTLPLSHCAFERLPEGSSTLIRIIGEFASFNLTYLI
jgi:hypothetical protein